MDASGEQAPERTPGRPPEWASMGFVGREPELALLARAADEARAGTPRLVRVEGPAGIGKTALLRRFLATRSDWTVLRAVCDPAETTLAYGVIAQLRRRGTGEHETPFDVGARLLATWTRRSAPGRSR
jgi:predicted ATPase